MNDQEIIAKIEQEELTAYGTNDSALSDARALALKYYNGEPFGNEVEGRSQVVSRDVLDVVETALPQVLKVFVSGDEVVKFEPRGPEDEEAAAQETDYVNYIVMDKNQGFKVFYTWFKDAMVEKNGYVKVFYEKETSVETEFYKGITDNQLQMLVTRDNVEVLEHTEYEDPVSAQQKAAALQQLQNNPDPNAQAQLQHVQSAPVPKMHDVKIQVTEEKGCIRIQNVAPEDMRVSTDCREVSVQNARFVQHLAMMTPAEIREQGWDVPENIAYGEDVNLYSESLARDQYNEQNFINAQEVEEALVKDTYFILDGKRQRFVVCGNSILHREDAEIAPFATITPHIMPHRHIGMSYSDLAEDVQLIKSTLLRSQLDNMYLANQPRTAISDKVNLEDMLTSRPGGVVRVSGIPGQEIMPLQSAPFPPTSFTLVEYFDKTKEARTGISNFGGAIDPDALSPNKTAAQVMTERSAEMARVELVSRTFAETGIKELFMLVHRLVRMYQDKPEVVKLRNKWVEVDPREWKNRYDMSITVGLGTGNKDQQLAHLNNIYQMQMGALQIGLPYVNPENLYNTLRQLVMNAGFKHPEEYVTDPKEVPPQPPKPDPEMIKLQMEQQADVQKFAAQAQLEKEKAMIESAKRDRELQMEAQVRSEEIQMEAEKQQRQAQADMIERQHKAELDAQLQAQTLEVDKWKARLQAETQILLKKMDLSGGDVSGQVTEEGLNQGPTTGDAIVAAINGFQQAITQFGTSIDALGQHMSRPKTIIRGPDGRAMGVQ